MAARKKHHFAPWSQDRSQLQGFFARAALQPGDQHSKCTACGINVKVGQQGGVKFWTGGRWVSRSPGCNPRPTV